jgi:O-antigen ligase
VGSFLIVLELMMPLLMVSYKKNSVQCVLTSCFFVLVLCLYYPAFYFKIYDGFFVSVLSLYDTMFYAEVYGGQRELQIIILLLLQCLLFLPTVFQQYINIIASVAVKIKVALIMFIVSGVIAALFVEQPLYAWGELVQTLLFVNALFVVLSVFVLYPHIKSIILAAILCGFFSGIVDFVSSSAAGLFLSGKIDLILVYPDFGNYRFFNQIQVQLVFIVASLGFILPVQYRNWIILLGSINVFMLLIAGARGAILSIGCIFFMSYFFSNQYLRQLSNSLLKAIIIGAIIYGLYLVYELVFLKSVSYEYLMRTQSSGRLAMWLEIIPTILKNPLGVGPYHYSSLPPVTSSGLSYQPSHPHNSVLQVFLEWGWLAGFSLFFLGVNFLLYIKNILSSATNHLHLAVGCSLLAACLLSLFSGVFVMPVSQITFIFILALCFSAAYKKVDNNLTSYDIEMRNATFAGCNIKVIMLAIVFCLSIFYGAYLFESYQRYSLAVYTSPDPMLTNGPRVWPAGGIVP